MNARMLITLACATSLTACATMERPDNASGALYARQQLNRNDSPSQLRCVPSEFPAELTGLTRVDPEAMNGVADQLSAGDRIRLTVAGDADILTGTYVIAADGRIALAGTRPVLAAGKSLDMLERDVRAALVAARLIRPLSNGVKLHQVELSGVPVSVTGAVFDGGGVRVGERSAEVRNLNLSNIVSGDSNPGRSVSTALRAAGGVRPDADLAAIYLVRGKSWAQLDMRAALDGGTVADPALTAGDRIIVGSTGCLQDALVRPSAVTAPGIRVYLSNLSRPAASNASSGIGKDSTSLPYGTRFLQALVNANCVGGSAMNAGRSAVLMSRNPVTGQSIVISRSVERLVRGDDRDAYNPWLMPGDAIACYDSAAMNLRDVVSVVSETVTPVVLFSNVK